MQITPNAREKQVLSPKHLTSFLEIEIEILSDHQLHYKRIQKKYFLHFFFPNGLEKEHTHLPTWEARLALNKVG